MKKKIDAKTVGALAPYIGLILVIVIFDIATNGVLLNSLNVKNMTVSVMTTALATIGAVFVFGAGYFDMSMGGCVCFSTILGCMAALKFDSLVAGIIVVFAVSLIFGIVKGIFAATVNVPFFIFTIVLGSVLSSAILVLMGDSTSVSLNSAATKIERIPKDELTTINLVCLIVFFVICVFLFNYTSLGVRIKNMGGNIISAKQSGIDVKKTTITTFIISAIGLAIASALILVRTRTITSGTAGSLGNDVMVALVLGGMPLSGGPRSKISAGIIGAATITILNSGLTILGLDVGQVQICRGIVFIAVVFISSFSYRSKLLPR